MGGGAARIRYEITVNIVRATLEPSYTSFPGTSSHPFSILMLLNGNWPWSEYFHWRIQELLSIFVSTSPPTHRTSLRNMMLNIYL